MNDRRAWEYEEDRAIVQLVRKYGNKRWAVISQKMIDTYGLKGRSGKQCRERWHNHLDQSINKTPWTQQQEKIIFESHKKYGNKWTEIAKHLEGRFFYRLFRTDNSIKNHFYSTLRRSLRRINKLLGSKNSTCKMKDIKPSVLSKIFTFAEHDINDAEGEEDKQMLSDCKGLSKSLLQFSIYKPENKDKKNHIIPQQDRFRFQNIINQIIKFNTAYENRKTDKLQIKKSVFLQNDKHSEDLSECDDEEIMDSTSNKHKQYKKIFSHQNTAIKSSKVQQNEYLIETSNKPKRVRKIKKIFEIPQSKKILLPTPKKQQLCKSQQDQFSQDQSSAKKQSMEQQQGQGQQNSTEFEKYLNTIKEVQNFKIMQEEERQRLELISYKKKSSKYSENEDLKKKLIFNENQLLDLNLSDDQNQFNTNTPQLISPKLPTPTNFFQSIVQFYKSPNTAQEFERKYNQIKNQIKNHYNKKVEQEKIIVVNSIGFLTSPNSAFRKY